MDNRRSAGRAERDGDAARVRALAREATPRALAVLVEIAEDPAANQRTRVAAASAILARGWADAPAQTAAVSVLEGLRIAVQQLVVHGAPVPGVLNSPIAGHLAAPTVNEVLDADGTIVPSVPECSPSYESDPAKG